MQSKNCYNGREEWEEKNEWEEVKKMVKLQECVSFFVMAEMCMKVYTLASVHGVMSSWWWLTCAPYSRFYMLKFSAHAKKKMNK